MPPTCQVPVLNGPETVIGGEYARKLECSSVQGDHKSQSRKSRSQIAKSQLAKSQIAIANRKSQIVSICYVLYVRKEQVPMIVIVTVIVEHFYVEVKQSYQRSRMEKIVMLCFPFRDISLA